MFITTLYSIASRKYAGTSELIEKKKNKFENIFFHG
jgi:hypothetical protein